MFAHVSAVITAAPAVPAVTPPFGDKIVAIAGWFIFGVGLAVVMAAAAGIGQLAWAHYQHRAGHSAMGLGIALVCGILLGSLGATMNGLF